MHCWHLLFTTERNVRHEWISIKYTSLIHETPKGKSLFIIGRMFYNYMADKIFPKLYINFATQCVKHFHSTTHRTLRKGIILISHLYTF